MEESYFWPCKGGTWRERLTALTFLLELLLIWGGYFALTWRLSR